MTTTPLGLTRCDWDGSDRAGFAYARTGVGGLVAAGSAGDFWNTAPDEVISIDEIRISNRSNSAATNLDVIFSINGNDHPFHFPGAANRRVGRVLSWKTKGLLVCTTSVAKSLRFSCATAASAHVYVRMRKIKRSEAVRRFDLGNGSWPNVASANTVSGGGTAAGTAKQIIPPVAGMAVEILGLVHTGHNYNAAADDIRLGFWDGTTNTTFAAGGFTIMRSRFQNAAREYSPEIVIGDTRGCIAGPVGWGVYIQATANVAGATPTADWIVNYRYVKAVDKSAAMVLNATLNGAAVTSVVMNVASGPQVPTDMPTSGTLRITRNSGTVSSIAYTNRVGATFTIGATDFSVDNASAGNQAFVSYQTPMGQANPSGRVSMNVLGKKFWVYTEDISGLGAATAVPFFALGGSVPSKARMRVRGTCGSAIGNNAGTSAGVAIGVGSGIGTSFAITEFQNINGDGASAASMAWADDDATVFCSVSQAPGFIGLDVGSAAVASMSQLAWGNLSGSETSPLNAFEWVRDIA